MTLLVIDWAGVGVKAAQFILSFSILVTLHELGHFITARWFKCRVEKFYLFFDPWFSIWKKKKGDTEYGIGWIPFGGYVKISGMIDESMDKEQMKLPPQPYEFRAKPAWQRLIIMVAGVIMNIALAIIIFIGITWKWGQEYLPAKNLSYGVHADSLAKSIGIKDGDNIIALDHVAVENFDAIERDIMLKEPKTMQILRDGQSLDISIPDGFLKNLTRDKNADKDLVEPRFPTIIDSIEPTAAFTSGSLQKGDTLVGINQHLFAYYNDFIKYRAQYKDSIVNLTAIRGKDSVHIRCYLKDGKVGFYPKAPSKIFGIFKKTYSFGESLSVGFKGCFETLGNYMTGLRQLFTGKQNANESLRGIVGIGNTFPAVWDWERFWKLTGIFSIILAFMNILPIPALDGGHALFTLIEIITGRKPSDKFMEYAQMVGMILLLGLMAYALGLDVWRLFK